MCCNYSKFILLWYWKKFNIYCWVTKRREIENYVPLEILKKVGNVTESSFEIGPYDDVMEKINKNNDCKVKLAIASTKLLTLEITKKDGDFTSELETELIAAINSFEE